MKKIRILTHNLGWLQGDGSEGVGYKKRSKLHFQSSISMIANLIKDNNIDLACFQEIDFNSRKSHYLDQFNIIKDKTGMQGKKIVSWDIPYLPFPYFNHWGKVVSGGAIIAKQEIIEVQNELFDAPANMFYLKRFFYLKRYVQVIKTKMNGKDEYIFNLHLEAFDFETKKEQLAALLGLVKKYKPIAVCGDFNTIPLGQNLKVDMDYSKDPATELLPKIMKGYKDIFGSEFTFPTGKENCRLDYIWVRSGIKAQRVKLNCLMNPSDHNPLALDLIFD